MRFHILSVLSVAYAIVAFPGMVADPAAKVHARQLLPSNLPLSSLEGNSGPMPSLSFNPTNQFVNVRSGTTHQFIAPSSTDERRLCPDLNAAANHGFLPLNSIISINQTVTGLNQAYSFGPEFAAALSVIANALTGIQLLVRGRLGVLTLLFLVLGACFLLLREFRFLIMNMRVTHRLLVPMLT